MEGSKSVETKYSQLKKLTKRGGGQLPPTMGGVCTYLFPPNFHRFVSGTLYELLNTLTLNSKVGIEFF
jgi:hypothetical protein